MSSTKEISKKTQEIIQEQEEKEESILLSNLKQLFQESVTRKEGDQKYICSNITWEEYNKLLAEIEDVSWCKISYLDGLLEIMSPSKNHENIKENIGTLIVAYCDEKEIDYILLGSTTYKNQDLKVGKEPDLSYAIAEDKEIPDIAVEINFSSGNIHDLDKYQKLGVKEVWMWNKNNKLNIYILDNSRYQQVDSSLFFKNINSKIMEKYVLLMNKDKSKTRTYKKNFIAEVNSNNFR